MSCDRSHRKTHTRLETMASFRIRHATTADIPALARLHVQTFNETHLGGQTGGPSSSLAKPRTPRMGFMRRSARSDCTATKATSTAGMAGVWLA